MFCGNCGSPLNGKNSFCGNCGAQVNNTPTNQGMPTRKKINPIIYIIPIIVFIIVVAIIVAHSLNSNSSSDVYGTWNCQDDIAVVFNKDKTFVMYNTYDKAELYVKGKYSIDKKIKDTNKDNIIKYSLTLTASHRVVDGETYDGSLSNKYEMVLSTDNLNEMAMVNEKTYNIYYCSK